MVKEGSHCSCFQDPLNLVPWPRLTWACMEIIMQFKCEEKWYTMYLPQIFMQGLLTSTLTPNKGKLMPCNAHTAGLLLHRPRPLFPPLSFSLDSIEDSVSSVYNLSLVYCRPGVFYTAIFGDWRILIMKFWLHSTQEATVADCLTRRTQAAYGTCIYRYCSYSGF